MAFMYFARGMAISGQPKTISSVSILQFFLAWRSNSHLCAHNLGIGELDVLLIWTCHRMLGIWRCLLYQYG